MITLQQLTKALHQAWDSDTAYDATEWSSNNKARGQCVVSSLLVQDYLGGELVRYEINEGSLHEMHYANQLEDGTIVDTTGSQYLSPVSMKIKPVALKGFASIRDKRLADTSTARRYEILKKRVEQLL